MKEGTSSASTIQIGKLRHWAEIIHLRHATSQWGSQSNSYLPAQAPLLSIASHLWEIFQHADELGWMWFFWGQGEGIQQEKEFSRKKKETCSDWKQDSSMHHGYYMNSRDLYDKLAKQLNLHLKY